MGKVGAAAEHHGADIGVGTQRIDRFNEAFERREAQARRGEPDDREGPAPLDVQRAQFMCCAP